VILPRPTRRNGGRETRDLIASSRCWRGVAAPAANTPDALVRMRGTARSLGMTTTAASPAQEACGIGAMSGTTAKGGRSCSARARCLCCAGTIGSTGPTVLQACTPRSAAQSRRGQDLRWATCGEIRHGHRPRGEAVVRRAAGGLARDRELNSRAQMPGAGRLGWRRRLVFRPPTRR
jgi:hypothetical protein